MHDPLERSDRLISMQEEKNRIVSEFFQFLLNCEQLCHIADTLLQNPHGKGHTTRLYREREESCSAGDGLGTLVIYWQVMDGFQDIFYV